MSSHQAPDFDRSLAESSAQSLSASYNSAKKINHPLLVFGLFDIFAHVRSFLPLIDKHSTLIFLSESLFLSDGVNLGGNRGYFYLWTSRFSHHRRHSRFRQQRNYRICYQSFIIWILWYHVTCRWCLFSGRSFDCSEQSRHAELSLQLGSSSIKYQV